MAVIARGTTASQHVARTTLAGLAGVDLGTPAVIVVGPVAALGAHDPVDSEHEGLLAGRTVVVTRAGERARGLVDALERVGATALELPLTRQVDPADGGVALRAAAAAVRDNAWVVVTSITAAGPLHGRAARRACARWRAGGRGRPGHGGRAAPVRRRARPGAGRAQRARARRGVPRCGGRLARGASSFPCADLAPGTIAEGLGQKGWDVRRVEAYRTVARAAPEPALLDRVTAADALTFTATSSVQAFMALRTAAGEPVTPPAHVVCIGPTTAAAARAAGLAGVHEAWGVLRPGHRRRADRPPGPRRGRGTVDRRLEAWPRRLSAPAPGGYPARRLRRLRRTPALRRLVAEARLGVDDLVAPLFVREGADGPTPIRVHAR